MLRLGIASHEEAAGKFRELQRLGTMPTLARGKKSPARRQGQRANIVNLSKLLNAQPRSAMEHPPPQGDSLLDKTVSSADASESTVGVMGPCKPHDAQAMAGNGTREALLAVPHTTLASPISGMSAGLSPNPQVDCSHAAEEKLDYNYLTCNLVLSDEPANSEEWPEIAEFTHDLMVYNAAQVAVSVRSVEDGGANRSFISDDLATKLGFSPRPSTKRVRLANQTVVPTLGTVNLKLQFLGHTTVYPFEVMKNCTYSMLLGRDLMVRFGLRSFIPIPIGTSTVTQNGGKVGSPPPLRIDLNSLGLTPEECVKRTPYLAAAIAEVRKNAQANPASSCSTAGSTRLQHPKDHPRPRPRSYKQADRERQSMLAKHVDDWIKNGWAVIWDPKIHKDLPWINPLYAVPKYDAHGVLIDVRPCMDMRETNKGLILLNRTKLPLIADIIARCKTGQLFSEIDLKKAFFNVPVHEDDAHKQAFEWGGKTYVFNRAAMGVTDTPSRFQEIMQQVISYGRS
jgi:hypothetical protein